MVPREKLPALLRADGTWVVIEGGWFWALFYLTDVSMKRVQEYKKKRWNPFPALFATRETEPALFVLDGTNVLLASNITMNGYAIRVGRRATIILRNHRHSVKDREGNQVEYSVDLAFIVGVDAVPEADAVESTFKSLFRHFMSTLEFLG